ATSKVRAGSSRTVIAAEPGRPRSRKTRTFPQGILALHSVYKERFLEFCFSSSVNGMNLHTCDNRGSSLEKVGRLISEYLLTSFVVCNKTSLAPLDSNPKTFRSF